jgi:hypothetical protein
MVMHSPFLDRAKMRVFPRRAQPDLLHILTKVPRAAGDFALKRRSRPAVAYLSVGGVERAPRRAERKGPTGGWVE